MVYDIALTEIHSSTHRQHFMKTIEGLLSLLFVLFVDLLSSINNSDECLLNSKPYSTLLLTQQIRHEHALCNLITGISYSNTYNNNSDYV